MKGILEFLAKNNRWAIVVVILLLLIGGGIFRFQNNKIKEWKNKHLTEVKLNKALNDTITYYQDAWGNEVAEKLTIQATVKQLEEKNGQLTDEQKELLAKIVEANDDKNLIAAALIRATFLIDSLKHAGGVDVDTTKKTVTYTEFENPNINYKIRATGVLPYPRNSTPGLLIDTLRIPNEQFIKYKWEDEKKEGYPVSFTVTNSNKYIHVTEMNSYIIPGVDKDVLNPTGWKRVELWFKRNGKIIGGVAGGLVVGAGGTYLLMQ